MAGGADLRGKRQSRAAAAAANVDNALARRDSRAGDQSLRDRRQDRVLDFLPVGPMLTAWSIPIGGLVGVFLMRR